MGWPPGRAGSKATNNRASWGEAADRRDEPVQVRDISEHAGRLRALRAPQRSESTRSDAHGTVRAGLKPMSELLREGSAVNPAIDVMFSGPVVNAPPRKNHWSLFVT